MRGGYGLSDCVTFSKVRELIGTEASDPYWPVGKKKK